MPLFRLDKYLGDAGIAARKDLKQMIRAGRVSINDRVEKKPETKVNTDTDVVRLDGEVIGYLKFRYFAMNKPAGVLSATEDGKQGTVLDLFTEEHKRLGLFPVGRLDKDTTGLLILTNDGEFAHKVISPKSHVSKRYFARTEGIPDEADVIAFRNGIELRDGLQCLPAELEITGKNECYVTVMEGKYHQVKRMLAACGKPVTELRRLSIGRYVLDEEIPSGQYVELEQKDLNAILWADS